MADVLPVLKLAAQGAWAWWANTRCKYIELRIDTRTGHCIIRDRERRRITPAEFAEQKWAGEPVSAEPWAACAALSATPAPTAPAQPVAYLSAQQLRGIPTGEFGGHYLAFRSAAEGLFDTPVYLAPTAPAQQLTKD